ncbi:NotI family restriction endonuclease [Zhaonella formicivorans]|jgi:hypothetical protein|uniref:NotI family restriction endonuclease n=1 Tax=Zhaonella formicivorans TaxID=2528593 RepID=UPI0010CF5912|nr:NotI family restriction endonuclease [Zhaonella formicivorans]
MPRAKKQDLCEIFGFAPDDLTPICRNYWNRGVCPFVGSRCTKHNHDKSVIYGVCSVVSGNDEIIICPKRLYAENYKTLKDVSLDAFGYVPLYLVNEVKSLELVKETPNEFVIAFGQNSGREIQVGSSRNKLSMDWVLVKIVDGNPTEVAGVEVQSIDITNNYRATWEAYKNLETNPCVEIPDSAHGMNWANVHKRLIPQIIRKGQVYADSHLATKGMYFIVPDVVYSRFEDIIGDIIPVSTPNKGVLSVLTYSLDEPVDFGKIRNLTRCRIIRVNLEDFALNFISGGKIPGSSLDEAVKQQVCTIFSK